MIRATYILIVTAITTITTRLWPNMITQYFMLFFLIFVFLRRKHFIFNVLIWNHSLLFLCIFDYIFGFTFFRLRSILNFCDFYFFNFWIYHRRRRIWFYHFLINCFFNNFNFSFCIFHDLRFYDFRCHYSWCNFNLTFSFNIFTSCDIFRCLYFLFVLGYNCYTRCNININFLILCFRSFDNFLSISFHFLTYFRSSINCWFCYTCLFQIRVFFNFCCIFDVNFLLLRRQKIKIIHISVSYKVCNLYKIHAFIIISHALQNWQ